MSDSQDPKAGTSSAQGEPDNKTPETNGGADPNEDKGGDQNKEKMVPQARLDQVYARMREAEKTRDELIAKEKQAEEDRMTKQNQFKELADKRQKELEEATAKLADKEKLEGTLQKYLDAELKGIPEDRQKLIPSGYSTREKLDYIIENRELLGSTATSQTPQNIDKSKRQPGVDSIDDKKARLEELKKIKRDGGNISSAQAREMKEVVDAIEKAATH